MPSLLSCVGSHRKPSHAWGRGTIRAWLGSSSLTVVLSPDVPGNSKAPDRPAGPGASVRVSPHLVLSGRGQVSGPAVRTLAPSLFRGRLPGGSVPFKGPAPGVGWASGALQAPDRGPTA